MPKSARRVAKPCKTRGRGGGTLWAMETVRVIDSVHGPVRVIDSHTGGEPTRTVVAGGPALGDGPLAERRERFRRDFDDFRSAVVCEPRGSDVVVGALARSAARPELRRRRHLLQQRRHARHVRPRHHRRRRDAARTSVGSRPGSHRIETPVGVVTTELHADGRVTVENVASRRHLARRRGRRARASGASRGDVAWGGNWFFLVDRTTGAIDLAPRRRADRRHLAHPRARSSAAGVTGAGGAEIDHIELFGPPGRRAPTAATSSSAPAAPTTARRAGPAPRAKLACLAEDGKLAPGEIWVQESVVGSRLRGELRAAPATRSSRASPARAHVTGEATLLCSPRRPVPAGIRAPGAA